MSTANLSVSDYRRVLEVVAHALNDPGGAPGARTLIAATFAGVLRSDVAVIQETRFAPAAPPTTRVHALSHE